MGNHGDDEESALRLADELLAQDEQDPTSSLHHHRRQSSTLAGHIPIHHHHAPPALRHAPRDLVASLSALVALSTIATVRIGALAQHASNLVVAVFPTAHFALLAVVVFALTRRHPSSSLGRTGFGTAGGGARANRKVMALAGATAAISFALRLWTSTRNDQRLCDSVDLFVLPTILFILPRLAARLPSGTPLENAVPAVFVHAIVLSTFMAGFSLIGIYGSSAKLLWAVVRLPFEASALLLLKEGLSDEAGRGEFLIGAVASATVTALATTPFGWFLALEPKLAVSVSTASVVVTLLFTVASHAALVVAIELFSSPLTATATLFARNFVALVAGSLTPGGNAIRDNWLQAAFVDLIGAIATAWADGDVAAAVRGISSSSSSRHGDAATGYSLLAHGNGSTVASANGLSPNASNPASPSLRPSASPPSSPSAATNRKSVHDKGSPAHSTSDPSSPATYPASASSSPFFALVPFIPLVLHLLQPPASNIPPLEHACSLLPASLRTAICPTTALPRDLANDTVDIVISYYDEALPNVKHHLDGMRDLAFVKSRNERIIIYNKGPLSTDEIRKGMELNDHDEVVELDNVGREGETYLKHILLMYNQTASDHEFSAAAVDPSLTRALARVRGRQTLAAHTFFLQPHLAWDFIARPRLALVGADTEFAHLGPLVEATCGRDERVNVDFPLWTQLYSIFRGGLCAPGGQTMAWSAQFVVSRNRILANSYDKYAYVDELMSAPKGHWIHDMWGPNESGGPSNPAFGHTVERAWPAIFDCWNPKIARECKDHVFDRNLCTCLG